MGTPENLAKIEAEVRQARRRIQALADRAVQLQARLRADAPFIMSLDKLTQDARQASMPQGWVHGEGEREGDDGKLLADAWEISLIGDDG
jgi:hypothetical protein